MENVKQVKSVPPGNASPHVLPTVLGSCVVRMGAEDPVEVVVPEFAQVLSVCVLLARQIPQETSILPYITTLEFGMGAQM